MTVFYFHPMILVLLILGILGMAILWRFRDLVAARVVARSSATIAMGLLAILVVISLSVLFVAPGPGFPSSRLLNWKLNSGGVGSSNAATAQTITAVGIEVEHPGCAPNDNGTWIADPIISSTPWSVTITMHMNDSPDVANCWSQQTPHEGSLPVVGSYLMGVHYSVELGEPLGGRRLFDGSSDPPAERSIR